MDKKTGRRFGMVSFDNSGKLDCFYVVSKDDKNLDAMSFGDAIERYNDLIKSMGLQAEAKILVEVPIETAIASDIKNGGTWIGGVQVCQEQLESKNQSLANSERK
ncbi:MAG: hypothetical protein Q4D65_10860 [Peptostreptococcaceae bacterium]|nr:hypothetical protein [Peptostreptococcaceae bacterium]